MKRFVDLVNPANVVIARNVLKKTIQGTASPVSVDGTKTFVINKFNDVNTFYKQLTGLDELEYYQDRIIELQNNLSEAQTKRRELSYILNEVRNKSIDIQDRLHKVKRHEDPAFFLELMREETDFIKKEREIFATLSDQERYERDVFQAFTNAIRDSQEKQRNRLEYAKYIGFGLTLLGALGSYIVTTWRTEDLKTVIRGSIKEDVKQAFVESVKDNVFLMQQMSKQQLAGHTKELNDVYTKLTSELAQYKTTFDEKFENLEGKINPRENSGYTEIKTQTVAYNEFEERRRSLLKWAGIIAVGYVTLGILTSRL